MRGELDWIVMKALEKDRRRRYETANDFAADVQRHLADEPVEACPPSAWYRFGKLARRNRAALTTAALVGLALVAGTALSTWQAIRATRAERSTAAALEDARRQRQRARKAVDDMYTQVAEKWLTNQAAATKLEREFLEKALASYQEFAAESGSDPQARYEVVRAWLRVGNIRNALQQLPAAETAFRQMVSLSADLVLQHPDRPEYRLELALGRVKLASLYRVVGKGDEAAREAALAYEELPKLRTAFPSDALLRHRLAEALIELSDELTRERRRPEAEACEQTAITIWEALIRGFPSDTNYRYGLAYAYVNQGTNLARSGGSLENAEAALRQADAHFMSLEKERPGDTLLRRNHSATLANLGVILHNTNRHAEAEATERRCLALNEGLAAEFPDLPETQGGLATALNNLAVTLRDLGRTGESEEFIRKAVRIRERLADRHPDVLRYQEELVGGLLGLAHCLRQQKKHEEARGVVQRAVLRSREFLKAHPEQRPPRMVLANSSFRLAGDLIVLGDHAGAARVLEDLPWDDLFVDPKLDSPGVQADVYLTAAQLLLDCAALAEQDAALPSDERAKATSALVARARSWLEESARLGVDECGVLCRLAELLSTTRVVGARDSDLALKVARRALEKADRPNLIGLARQTLGWAQYRAGDWKGCIESLEMVQDYQRDGDYFAAMAHWQLGDEAEARTLFHKSDMWLPDYERRWTANERRGVLTHPEPAMLRRIRAEAAALLGVDAKTTEARAIGPEAGTVSK
jgi:tetratricopeptide (TPR) repeat protein